MEVEPWVNNLQLVRQSSLAQKKYVLIDLSGTLHIEDTQTQNASTALNLLRFAGFKILFVTNTTVESKRMLYERLIRIGFLIYKDEIFTSMTSSRQYIEKRGIRPLLMVSDEALEDFDGINVEEPNAVLVGLSRCHFNYETMNKAFRLLLKPDTELLAIHKGRQYRTKAGMCIGPGAFIISLEVSSEKKTVVLGKPEEAFFRSALDFIGCDDEMDAVMIGDDIRDDVIGAMKLGITGILVKTGKYKEFDEEQCLPVTPDFKVAHFSEAVDMILKLTGNCMGFFGCESSEMAAKIGEKRREEAKSSS